VVAAVAIALIAAAGVLARTLTGPDPQVLAGADGCERSDTLLQTGRAPNWVYVFDSTTKASDPTPPLKWAGGVVNSNGLPWYSPHVSGGDTPYSHSSYDMNMDVRLDTPYADLIGSANTATAGLDSGEAGRLHTERESAGTPFFVYPEPGDRVSLLGYWTWDCDHYQPAGERTEMHPIMAFWVQRASSVRSRAGEIENDLFLTTDKTEAGTQADCAHEAKHDQDAFKQCVAAEPNFRDMRGTYGFLLKNPPGTGPLRVRVVDAGSVAAPKVVVDGRKVSVTIPSDGKRHVIAKQFFVRRDASPRMQHLRVAVDKVVIRRSMDPGCLPQKAPPCGTLETTHEDQVTQGPNGEWNFYWDVGGKWSLWKPTVFKVRDGQTIRPRVSTDVWVPSGRPFRVFVWTRECDWGTLALGGSGALTPCPKQPEVGVRAGDDVPGGALATFTGPGTKTLVPQWGIGSCPRAANPRGCYAVTVRVRRVG
jgi:hypothetical protein